MKHRICLLSIMILMSASLCSALVFSVKTNDGNGADSVPTLANPDYQYGTRYTLAAEGSDYTYESEMWLKFDTATIKSSFDSIYTGGWNIDGITIKVVEYGTSWHEEGEVVVHYVTGLADGTAGTTLGNPWLEGPGGSSGYGDTTDPNQITWNNRNAFKDGDTVVLSIDDGDVEINTSYNRSWTLTTVPAALDTQIKNGEAVSFYVYPSASATARGYNSKEGVIDGGYQGPEPTLEVQGSSAIPATAVTTDWNLYQ